MKFWILFLVATFLVGGTRLGRWGRERPWAIVAGCTVAAASFYSIGIAT
jgi:biotin transporter BioY